MNPNNLIHAFWRQRGGGDLSMKDYILIDTLKRLTCCTAVLIQSIEAARSSGGLSSELMGLVGACDLLESITEDLWGEVRAAMDSRRKAEREAQP